MIISNRYLLQTAYEITKLLLFVYIVHLNDQTLPHFIIIILLVRKFDPSGAP